MLMFTACEPGEPRAPVVLQETRLSCVQSDGGQGSVVLEIDPKTWTIFHVAQFGNRVTRDPYAARITQRRQIVWSASNGYHTLDPADKVLWVGQSRYRCYPVPECCLRF